MKAYTKRKALRVLLGIVLYMAAIAYGSEVLDHLKYTQIILDRPILGADVQRIQQQEWEAEEPVGFCFWGQAPGQYVSCRETGGIAAVTPVFLAGNPELMDAGLLAWQAGCLVDPETAKTLFGTASVGSQTLWFREKPYPVLGMIEASRPTLVLLADAEAELEQIVLALPPERGSTEAAQYLMRWGISGTVLDSTLIGSLIHNSLLLFPFLLTLLVCAHLRKGWRELSWDGVLYGSQLPLLGKAVACAGLFLGAIWLLGRQVMIPKSMIPTKWSDFSFWHRWWQTQRENAVAILFAPMGNSRLQMVMNMVKSGIGNLFACLMLVWPARRE